MPEVQRKYDSEAYTDTSTNIVSADLPPSTLFLAYVLRENGPATQEDLINETGMKPRTVRDALSRLRDAGAVSKQPNPLDLRQSIYALEGSGDA